MLKTRTNFESQGNLIFPSPQDDYSKEEYGETDQRFWQALGDKRKKKTKNKKQKTKDKKIF